MTSKIIFLSAVLLLIPSCAKKPGEKPQEAKKEESPKPHIVGRIASIPADRKFVLIQSYGSWDVETGSILTTQGPEGRTANLRATGEKLGQYAAADIQSGTLEIGDGVYTVPVIPKKPDPPVEAEEEKPLPLKTAEPEKDTSILAP